MANSPRSRTEDERQQLGRVQRATLGPEVAGANDSADDPLPGRFEPFGRVGEGHATRKVHEHGLEEQTVGLAPDLDLRTDIRANDWPVGTETGDVGARDPLPRRQLVADMGEPG